MPVHFLQALATVAQCVLQRIFPATPHPVRSSAHTTCPKYILAW